jgi:hypothetical protein
LDDAFYPHFQTFLLRSLYHKKFSFFSSIELGHQGKKTSGNFFPQLVAVAYSVRLRDFFTFDEYYGGWGSFKKMFLQLRFENNATRSLRQWQKLGQQ